MDVRKEALRSLMCRLSFPQDAQKTSLQRAYAERMARGEPIKWGRGFFVYRDGKVYNR